MGNLLLCSLLFVDVLEKDCRDDCEERSHAVVDDVLALVEVGDDVVVVDEIVGIVVDHIEVVEWLVWEQSREHDTVVDGRDFALVGIVEVESWIER